MLASASDPYTKLAHVLVPDAIHTSYHDPFAKTGRAREVPVQAKRPALAQAKNFLSFPRRARRVEPSSTTLAAVSVSPRPRQTLRRVHAQPPRPAGCHCFQCPRIEGSRPVEPQTHTRTRPITAHFTTGSSSGTDRHGPRLPRAPLHILSLLAG
jgi:hypothetical protein